jgi:hypothetical protein
MVGPDQDWKEISTIYHQSHVPISKVKVVVITADSPMQPESLSVIRWRFKQFGRIFTAKPFHPVAR